MILDFIFEHIPILKQLPDFSSCRVFETYPGFETITRFQLMSRFRNISWFWDNYWNSYKCQFSSIYFKSSNLCPFLTLSVRNGPSVSSGFNVPWSIELVYFLWGFFQHIGFKNQKNYKVLNSLYLSKRWERERRDKTIRPRDTETSFNPQAESEPEPVWRTR